MFAKEQQPYHNEDSTTLILMGPDILCCFNTPTIDIFNVSEDRQNLPNQQAVMTPIVTLSYLWDRGPLTFSPCCTRLSLESDDDCSFLFFVHMNLYRLRVALDARKCSVTLVYQGCVSSFMHTIDIQGLHLFALEQITNTETGEEELKMSYVKLPLSDQIEDIIARRLSVCAVTARSDLEESNHSDWNRDGRVQSSHRLPKGARVVDVSINEWMGVTIVQWIHSEESNLHDPDEGPVTCFDVLGFESKMLTLDVELEASASR
jgi:hypothetical protein